MHEVGRADRAELAGGEETGGGNRSQGLGNALGVVIALGEQVRAAAVASEDQCSGRSDLRVLGQRAKQLFQVVVRRLVVAEVELHRLSRSEEIAGHDRTVPRVDSQHIAD